jgi:5-methylcytosine-specific restriction protein A
MPNKPKKPCSKIGCRELTIERYCQEHKQEKWKGYDKERGSAYERGYTSRWNKYSKMFRRKNPLCVMCLEKGVLTPSEHTDHIIAVSGADDPLFWQEDNHQALCAPCHSKKTVEEDGGFTGK